MDTKQPISDRTLDSMKNTPGHLVTVDDFSTLLNEVLRQREVITNLVASAKELDSRSGDLLPILEENLKISMETKQVLKKLVGSNER